jgi:hypothetical protein
LDFANDRLEASNKEIEDLRKRLGAAAQTSPAPTPSPFVPITKKWDEDLLKI